MDEERKIKVIVSMIGLDGHTTGGEVVSTMLRDAGMEVVYLGCNQTPEMITQAAIQEDVDVVGISSHAANYDQIELLVDLMKKKLDNVLLLCGGNIPAHSGRRLKMKGVAEIFPPGSSGEDIVGYIRSHVGRASESSTSEAVRVV